METRHLRYFVAAVEEGSLRGAAQRMNVAQPALSRRIRDLEASLACALLERHTHGVRPTRAGAHFYGEALVLLDGLDRATQHVGRMAAEQSRPVRLGLVQTSTKYGFVRDAIAGSSDNRPQHGLDYSRASSAALAVALREGRIDLTLLYERHPGATGLRERLIHKERYVAAMHPAHRLGGSGALELARLSGEPLVWLSRRDNPDHHDGLLQQCRLHGLEPRIGHSATSHDEQIELAIVSAGLCLTPASTMLSVPPGRLLFRPLSRFAMELHLSLAWNTDTETMPGAGLLNGFQTAIDRHQAAIHEGTLSWARLDGHKMVLLPDDDEAP